MKRNLWNIFINLVSYWFVRKKPLFSTTQSNVQYNTMLITIAFNNAFLIDEQIRLIKKYITDDNYVHIVVDNSSDFSTRKQIQDICIKQNIAYVALPKNPFTMLTKWSCSHSLALNWAYRNLINVQKPAFFGFLDHDLFPTKPYSVLQKIKNQEFYGTLVDRIDGWYLWAGFCFFNYQKIKDLKLNFFPYKVGKNHTYLDTGGGNYPVLYSKYDKEKVDFALPIIEKSIREGGNRHSDIIHFIDNDWLHTINGSYWKKVTSKDDILKQILSEF